MKLLLMQIIQNPHRRLPHLPPKLLPIQQPQNLHPIRIKMQRAVGRPGEILEIGEVGEEFLVFEVSLLDQDCVEWICGGYYDNDN